jgi:hypothetical protein
VANYLPLAVGLGAVLIADSSTGCGVAGNAVVHKLSQEPFTNHRGGSPQFPGVLVGPLLPLAVRKCHQMPYVIKRAHATRLGRPLGLITHPGYPAAGRRGRVVPVPPLLLCTRPARARPSIGGQSPPSRSALAPVGSSLPGAGALAG